MCLVDDLSCDVGEYYEGVIFWECWDVKDGSGLRECVWGQCVGGDCGEELPCFPGLRAKVETVGGVLSGAVAQGAAWGVDDFHVG